MVLWKELTRENPLAGWLLKGVTTPCWLKKLVVCRCAACEGCNGEKCAGKHCGCDCGRLEIPGEIVLGV